MKTRKSIAVVVLTVVLIGSTWMLFRFLPIHCETMKSIKIWQGFCNMISEGRIAEANQKCIDSQDNKHYVRMRDFLKLDKDNITYCGIDITEKLPKWKCKYVDTFLDHYWKRYGEYQKVNFEAGYALLKDGKIVYMKIP